VPELNGQGQSSMTIKKEQELGALLDLEAKLLTTILAKHPYLPQCFYYVDANAGSGTNELVGCDGSPIVFLKTIGNFGLPYQAHFVEINALNVAGLWTRITEMNLYSPNMKIHHANNAEAVPKIVSRFPNNAYGVIYFDSNGIGDLDLIKTVAVLPTSSKLDVLLRFSGTSLKRNPQRGKLTEHLAEIAKRYWLVQEPEASDDDQWTFLLGTNWPDWPSWGSHRFFDTRTARGKAILEVLTYTKKELAERLQPSFFIEATRSI
jgi:three-Cys-motif partner protein